MLLVLGGRVGENTVLGHTERLGHSDARTPGELAQLTELAAEELEREHASVLGIVVNRADPERLAEIVEAVRDAGRAGTSVAVWAIPEDPFLVAPSMRTIMHAVDGELYAGDPDLLDREALGVVIAAMSMENVLPRLIEGSVVIVPGDRSEVLLGVLTAHASATFPSISGIVLNGGFPLSEQIERLIEGLKAGLPIIQTDARHATTPPSRSAAPAAGSPPSRSASATPRSRCSSSTSTARRCSTGSRSRSPRSSRRSCSSTTCSSARDASASTSCCPRATTTASCAPPPRCSRATSPTSRSSAKRSRSAPGPSGSASTSRGPTVLSNHDHVLVYRLADEYQRRRAHKGVTLEQARDTVQDVSYFGTMMVAIGLADGMVSGAAHTTAHTIRPAFEIIKTEPEVDVVSSVFLMALADRVLVYGDCAVVPDPTAEQLADIAISSAATAAQFGIESRVAMLSYSTGESGSGADVDKVRRATALVRERAPELAVEGPIQYDAAADAAVAAHEDCPSPPWRGGRRCSSSPI